MLSIIINTINVVLFSFWIYLWENKIIYNNERAGQNASKMLPILWQR